MAQQFKPHPAATGSLHASVSGHFPSRTANQYGLTPWMLCVLLSVGFLLPYAPFAAPFAAPFQAPALTTPPGEPELATIVQSPTEHSDVLAAGFGFQAADSSMITVRTYHAQTGAVLSEDSFDLNVKEEGAAEHDDNRGRIFAGGMGIDASGKSKFILRVYDAETGRFLWEGQLNLLKSGEGGTTKTSATLTPNRSTVRTTGISKEKPLQTLFFVRAVNPSTGGVVWQDQFTPGSRKKVKSTGILFDHTGVRPVGEPIGHVFDLVVKTYERGSGKLLWEDSFEELDHIDEPASEPDTDARPQAIPLWNSHGSPGAEIYQTRLR